MICTIHGLGTADDGITIRINGVDTRIMLFPGPVEFYHEVDINFNDVLEIYNYDGGSGTCWSAGKLNFTISYNSRYYVINWASAYSYCGVEVCKAIGWTKSMYPARLLAYNLTSNGPIRIDDKEIAKTEWFNKESLPQHPLNISIAGDMIGKFEKREL